MENMRSLAILSACMVVVVVEVGGEGGGRVGCLLDIVGPSFRIIHA